jgi:hypothetical protein
MSKKCKYTALSRAKKAEQIILNWIIFLLIFIRINARTYW